MRGRVLKVGAGVVVAGIVLAAAVLFWWNQAARAEPLPGASDEARGAAVAANQFGLELYGKLCGRPGNLLLSPYSVYTALAMSREGASGKTAEELVRALHLGENGAAGLRDLRGRLQAPGYHGFALAVANRLWADKKVSVLGDFRGRLKDVFDAEMELVDFGDAAGAAKGINEWAGKQTRGRIPTIVSPADLTPQAAIVLTNALYFKGNWDKPFKKSATHEGDFFTVPGSKVRVKFMFQEKKHHFTDIAEAADAPAFRALAVDHAGGDLSMLLLLPEVGQLDRLEKVLSGDFVAKIVEELSETELPVTLPRFGFEDSFELSKPLKELGIVATFDPGAADFSRMSGGRLFVTGVLHRTFVEVNEEGTEAAAVTAVAAKAAAVHTGRPPEFKADHPFLFLIRDKGSGAILFVGRVANPAGRGE